LDVKEAIADNAQYLMDSESFIKQNNYAKIKKFSFLFLAFVVVMGCNTKNKEDHSAHQEGESIFSPVRWIPK
jgi:hypothetical protein